MTWNSSVDWINGCSLISCNIDTPPDNHAQPISVSIVWSVVCQFQRLSPDWFIVYSLQHSEIYCFWVLIAEQKLIHRFSIANSGSFEKHVIDLVYIIVFGKSIQSGAILCVSWFCGFPAPWPVITHVVLKHLWSIYKWMFIWSKFILSKRHAIFMLCIFC